jgi:hypothetical protein
VGTRRSGGSGRSSGLGWSVASSRHTARRARSFRSLRYGDPARSASVGPRWWCAGVAGSTVPT